MTWEDAKRGDGPTFAAWLRRQLGERHIDPIIGQVGARALNRWEHGESPSFEVVDKYAVLVGTHVSQVPDEVWVS